MVDPNPWLDEELVSTSLAFPIAAIILAALAIIAGLGVAALHEAIRILV